VLKSVVVQAGIYLGSEMSLALVVRVSVVTAIYLFMLNYLP
jgi:hypothetical protein